MKKITYKLLFLIIVIVFINKVNTTPLIPQVYISAGVSNYNNNIYTKNNYTDLRKSPTENGTALNMALGIVPINLPIFNMFALEGQYYNNFNKTIAINHYGIALITSVKIIPFVSPYIGFGYHSGTVNFKNGLPNVTSDYANLLTYNKKNNSNFYSLQAGANVNIPLIGLGMFVEYKLLTSNLKVSTTDTNNNATTIKYGLLNHNIVFGIKYFIL